MLIHGLKFVIFFHWIRMLFNYNNFVILQLFFQSYDTHKHLFRFACDVAGNCLCLNISNKFDKDEKIAWYASLFYQCQNNISPAIRQTWKFVMYFHFNAHTSTRTHAHTRRFVQHSTWTCLVILISKPEHIRNKSHWMNRNRMEFIGFLCTNALTQKFEFDIYILGSSTKFGRTVERMCHITKNLCHFVSFFFDRLTVVSWLADGRAGWLTDYISVNWIEFVAVCGENVCVCTCVYFRQIFFIQLVHHENSFWIACGAHTHWHFTQTTQFLLNLWFGTCRKKAHTSTHRVYIAYTKRRDEKNEQDKRKKSNWNNSQSTWFFCCVSAERASVYAKCFIHHFSIRWFRMACSPWPKNVKYTDAIQYRSKRWIRFELIRLWMLWVPFLCCCCCSSKWNHTHSKRWRKNQQWTAKWYEITVTNRRFRNLL